VREGVIKFLSKRVIGEDAFVNKWNPSIMKMLVRRLKELFS